MSGPKDTPQPGPEVSPGVKKFRQRERLPEPAIEKVRGFLAPRFKPVDLADTTFDTLIPLSMDATTILLITGFAPSFNQGGFSTFFPREDLESYAQGGVAGELSDLALEPLSAAHTIAQRHGLLAELGIMEDLPITNSGDLTLWGHLTHPRDEGYLQARGFTVAEVKEALERIKGSRGVLIGVKGLGEDFLEEDIPHGKIEVIMGLGRDRSMLASRYFLNIDPSHPALHGPAYLFDGRPLSSDTEDRGEILGGEVIVSITGAHDDGGKILEGEIVKQTPEAPEPKIPRNSILLGLKALDGWKKWDIVSQPSSAEDPWDEKRDSGMEMTEGYLNLPSYRFRMLTRTFVLPEFDEVPAMVSERNNFIDPLITPDVIQSFYESHKDRYSKGLADRVSDSLFRPFQAIAQDPSLRGDAIFPPEPTDEREEALYSRFVDWKKAKLHLWHVQNENAQDENTGELGIQASTLRKALERNRLTELQGLNLAGNRFLSELLEELNAGMETEKDKWQSTFLLHDYLQHFTKSAAVFEGVSFFNWSHNQEVQVNILNQSEAQGQAVFVASPAGPDELEAGVINLTIGDHRSSIRADAHILENTLQFHVTHNRERDPELTSDESWRFTDALKATVLVKLLPKAILDVFGSYDEFQKYLHKYGLEWNDPREHDDDPLTAASRLPLYSPAPPGLAGYVEKLQSGDENALHEVRVAQKLARVPGLLNAGITTLKKLDPELLDEAA